MGGSKNIILNKGKLHLDCLHQTHLLLEITHTNVFFVPHKKITLMFLRQRRIALNRDNAYMVLSSDPATERGSSVRLEDDLNRIANLNGVGNRDKPVALC